MCARASSWKTLEFLAFRIEVVATGLSHARGVPPAVDSTIVSPLSMKGRPHSGAARLPGVTLERAAKDKHRTYRELVGSNDLRLAVDAVDTGGRSHADARALLRFAAVDREAREPTVLRAAVCWAF